MQRKLAIPSTTNPSTTTDYHFDTFNDKAIVDLATYDFESLEIPLVCAYVPYFPISSGNFLL